MTREAILLVAALLAAGCLGAPAPGATDAAAGEEGRETHFLSSAMVFARAPEKDTHAVRAGGFFRAWAHGTDYPTWAADPFADHRLVTEANVTLYVRATGPVAESGRFPDVMLYAGSGDAWMGFATAATPSVLVPGATYKLDFDLALPHGGLWLPPGERFGLKVVPVMFQEEHNDIEILVGGDAPSGVTWRHEPVDVGTGAPASGAADGEVVGTIYAGPAAPATTTHTTRIHVPAGAQYVVAWMNTTDHAGIPDLDLALVGPDGEEIAGSGTPTPRDAIRVAWPNLDGEGTYGLSVTTAGSPRATFRVEWIIA